MRIPPDTLRPLAAPPPCRTTAAAPAAAAAAPSTITNVRGRIMTSPSSDICEGFADGDAGGAGCCCFGGEYRAGDDDPADSPGGCSNGVHDTELSGPIEDVGAHRRG